MTWNIEIECIAGILDGDAKIENGLNAVRGSNWQGKSSFIEAVKTALGTSTELTEGADMGRVHLQTRNRDVDVTLTRENNTVTRSGTPYLTDEYDVIRAELFACLDERNEVRHAVRQGENLEEVLLRPLDFQNIDEQIVGLKREREQVDSELSQAREAKKRLPTVQESVTQLEHEIEDLRARREAIDEGVDDDAGSTWNQLSQARTERSQAANRVERLEQSIERTEARLEDRRDELDGLEVADNDPKSELTSARRRLQQVKRDKEVLQSLYSANERVLTENRLDLVTDVERELSGDTVACWTCGEETTREDVEDSLDELGTRITELRAETERHRDRVEQLEARREEITQTKRRKQDLEREVADLEEKLADQRQSLEDALEQLADADDRVDELSESVDETMSELSDVESDVKYREAELKDKTNELEQLEARADDVEMLEARREEISEEITELRNRKDRIKQDARTAFDDAMQEILSLFDTGFETARLTSNFEIVVAREGQEVNITALSEGELELIGFVAALAGRESFDVAKSVPLLLVDGVGGLADDNLHTLINYLGDGTEYLVFTAYPEYTAFEGREIDPTAWTVANDRRASSS